MGMAPGMSPSKTTGMMTQRRHKMIMHMTFFWGKNTEVLFSGWPGTRSGMYVLTLVTTFSLAFFLELLNHARFIKPRATHLTTGLIQTLMHAMRIGLAYLVMLAVMSFNGGVFLAAVAGHILGFCLFGSRVFNRSPRLPDLPPCTC